MYRVAVQRKIEARHYLTGGNWGDENSPHSHDYTCELLVSGQRLDSHGYLVDIVDLEGRLEKVISAYRDKLLNDLSVFAGLNPSVEHFCRIVAADSLRMAPMPNVSWLRVTIWEDGNAWASYEEAVK